MNTGENVITCKISYLRNIFEALPSTVLPLVADDFNGWGLRMLRFDSD